LTALGDLLYVPAEVNLGSRWNLQSFSFYFSLSNRLRETPQPHHGLMCLQREGARRLPKKRGTESGYLHV
jgi:hypothetical protein